MLHVASGKWQASKLAKEPRCILLGKAFSLFAPLNAININYMQQRDSLKLAGGAGGWCGSATADPKTHFASATRYPKSLLASLAGRRRCECDKWQVASGNCCLPRVWLSDIAGDFVKCVARCKFISLIRKFFAAACPRPLASCLLPLATCQMQHVPNKNFD